MYTIGEIAAMFRIPVSTLRYYDREGLFPDLQRRGGARCFTDREIEALRVIECLKRSGLEIRDIRQFMAWCAAGPETYGQRRDLFARRAEAVEAAAAQLEQALAMLRFKIWYYDRAMEDGGEDRIQAMLPDRLPPEIQALYDRAHGGAARC